MISAYNRRMHQGFTRSYLYFSRLLLALFVAGVGGLCLGQATSKAAPSASAGGEAERGATLAESGHCAEALPLLRKSGPADAEPRSEETARDWMGFTAP